MLIHKSDIEKRLKENPEPIEVTKMREHILSSFANLEFIEEGHKYYLHNEDGSTTEMISVSQICHMFEPFVDWDLKAEQKALKEGVETETIKRRWRETNLQATSNGSLTHLFAEGYMWFFMGHPENIPEVIFKMQYEDGFLIPYGVNQQAIVRFYEDLLKINNFWCVLPETKIYISSKNNPYGIKHNISGTFDALFAFKNKKGEYNLSIFDWKTNKSLFNDYNQSYNITLLEPFDKNFIAQPQSIYTLQLSLYQLGLAQLGYHIADRKLVWLSGDGNYHKIPVPNVTNLLIDALK